MSIRLYSFWYNTPTMTNHEGERQPNSPSHEAQIQNHEREQSLRSLVTPERARLIAYAATNSREFLSPRAITPEATLERSIKQANVNNLPFSAGEKVSLERRQAYWQEGERANLSFAEKNQQWNGSTHRAILSLTTTPEGADQQRVAKATLARETLNHLGLTGGDATVEKTFTLQEKGEQRLALFSDIETFRTTYFEGGRSDIKGFVRKLAEQYPGTNGQVDALNLKDRLDAIRPLLGSFGDQSVDSLVEDFAISYGLLSQSEQNKAIVAREAKSQLYPPLGVVAQKGWPG